MDAHRLAQPVGSEDTPVAQEARGTASRETRTLNATAPEQVRILGALDQCEQGLHACPPRIAGSAQRLAVGGQTRLDDAREAPRRFGTRAAGRVAAQDLQAVRSLMRVELRRLRPLPDRIAPAFGHGPAK